MPREMPTERVSGVKKMTLSVEVFFFGVFGDFSDLVSLSEVTSCCSAAPSFNFMGRIWKKKCPKFAEVRHFGGHSTGNFEKKKSQLGRWPSTTTPSNNHRIMLAAYSGGCGVDRKYTCIPRFDKNNRPIWELETHQGSGHCITNPNFMHYYRRREIPQIYHTFASSLVSTKGESKH